MRRARHPDLELPRLVALCAAACAALGFGSCWTSADLAAPGPYAVGSVEGLVLQDAERDREIPFLVRYPAEGEPGVATPDAPLAADGPFPLIVSAHGLGSSPQILQALQEHLASHGFVVAAPKFPGSILENTQPELTNDIVNHPGDVSLVIDAVLGEAPGLPPELVGAADPQRVGMMGLSFGGLATYLTAFDRELRDPRIRMAITLAGGAGDLFEPLFYEFVGRPLPLLLIHGSSDALVEFESTSGAVFQNANWPVSRVALEGGTHIGYLDPAPVIPGTHPDVLACLFLPPIDLDDPELGLAFQYLSGRTPDTGVLPIGDAPLPCSYGVQDDPTWMEPVRQAELTRVAALAFALSRFAPRPATRFRAGRFLHETFGAENPDADFEAKPFSLDWLAGP